MIKKIIKFVVLSIMYSSAICPFFDPDTLRYSEIQMEFNDIPRFVVKKSAQRVWDNREKIAKQIEESFTLQEDMFVPELKKYYIICNQRREDALKEMIANDNTYFKQTYHIDSDPYYMSFNLFGCCPDLHVGNTLMQIMHVELLQVNIELDKVKDCNFLLRHIDTFTALAINYNRIGHVDKAILLADLCWAVLDAVVAIKMRLVKGSAQTCIVKQFAKIFSICDLTLKINNQRIEFESLQKAHQAATEKLQAMSTRSVVVTEFNPCMFDSRNPYPHEDSVMSKLLEEIRLWCTNIMKQAKVSSVAVEKTKKRWWFW